MSNVKKWATKFKCGRTSLKDDPHERQSKTVTTPKTIKKVHDMQIKMSCGEIGRKVAKHFAQRIRNAKAVPKMGSAFAKCRSKANAQMTCAAMFRPIQ